MLGGGTELGRPEREVSSPKELSLNESGFAVSGS